MADDDGLAIGGRGELVPPTHVKLFYSLGQIAQSGAFDTALPFIFFYYTAVLGLPGGMVGVALAISLVFDAVVDPVVGSWSDNIGGKIGRRLPLMIVGAPLMCIALGLLFAPPTHLPATGLMVWLTVSSIAVRSLVSVFNVPYIALGAEMADGYTERSSVVAWRALAGIVFAVLVNVLAFNVYFAKAPGLLRAQAYPGFGWAVGLAVLIACAACCAGVLRYGAALPRPPKVQVSILRRLPGEIGEVFRNPSFRLLFSTCVIFFVAIGVNATLNNHVLVFLWKFQPWMMQVAGFCLLGGVLAGIATAPLLARFVEKKTMVIVGLVSIIAVWILLPVLYVTGLVRPTGVAALPYVGFVVFVAGIGIGFAAIAFPSMMADVADEHDLLFNARREGLYFAGLGFAAKASAGLGSLIGGFAIQLIGFPQNAAQAGVVLSPVLLDKLILAWGPGAALVGAVGVVVFWPYAITRKRHEVIASELKARRAEALALANIA
jgi:glycoside/pentoside/hexuronide:cation symporter, GPH family